MAKRRARPPHPNVDKVALAAAAAAQAADPSMTSITVKRYDGPILLSDTTLDFESAAAPEAPEQSPPE